MKLFKNSALFNQSLSLSKYYNSITLFTLFLIGIYYFLSEKSPEPFGGDARYYIAVAKDFYNYIPVIDYMMMKKILVPFVVHHLLFFVGADFNETNIVYGFTCINLLVLGIVGYLWGKITDELYISFFGKIFGLIALLINFSILK